MCGIIGYTGHRHAIPLLLDGLKKLEYRGYDSAGIAFHNFGKLEVVKTNGKLSCLEKCLDDWAIQANPGYSPFSCEASDSGYWPFCGIGHTRWATHGVPNQVNAHPHCDGNYKMALVHNGIIENFYTLRQELENKGYNFISDTDTEVLSHLIAEGCKLTSSIPKAMSWALSRVEGSFAIALISQDHSGQIWAARKSSPLILGIGQEGNFVASDIPAFLSITRDVVFIEDGEIISLKKDSWEIMDLQNLEPKSKTIQRINWDFQAAEKEGYAHFMLKEIFEQPRVIENCLRGRIDSSSQKVIIPEIDHLPVPDRIKIVACGTSFHAGLWSKYLLENWARIPVEVDIASEFRYRDHLFQTGDLVIAISQSGETADTLAGLRIAAENQIPILGLCNVVGSSVARESDAVLYTQAGPEISVASTKAMCSQMTALFLLSLFWGQKKDVLPAKTEANMISELTSLPRAMHSILPQIRSQAQDLVYKYQKVRSFLFLGRGLCYPLALEGALKLKEISYIHAEGYAAGEMKHGPIALIDPDFPTFALALNDHLAPKVLSNLKEVLARRGNIIMLTNPGIEFEGPDRWEIPDRPWPVSSFLVLPAIQLFAYEMAVILGKDVDQPRNLAKSVTVE